MPVRRLGSVGQRRGQRVEQVAGGRGVARGGANQVARGRHPPCDDAQRVGAGIEALAELVLDAGDRFLIGGAESRTFERESGGAHDQGGRHAGAGEAQKDSLRGGQTTGWWHEVAGSGVLRYLGHRIIG